MALIGNSLEAKLSMFDFCITNNKAKPMQLVYENGGKPVLVGDLVPCHNEDAPVEVLYITKPHKPSSTGRVGVKFSDGSHREFFPGVIGAEWINRDDQ